MVVFTEGRESAQLAMDFTRKGPGKMPAQVRRKAPKISSDNAPSPIQLRGEISRRLHRYAVCSLAKMLHDIKKSNPAGYPYYFKELFRIFNAYEEKGKVRMDSPPTPEQTAEAHLLLLNLERQHLLPNGRAGNMKWARVTREHQQAASAKEHFSNLCTLAGLNSLFKAGQYKDFHVVFGLLEKPIMGNARKPAAPGEPRVSGHEVRLFLEIRNSGIPEKAEILSRLDPMQ
jgi:hypothetical protein